MRRRRGVPGSQYCVHCAQDIPEQQFQIHRLVCRNRALNEALANTQQFESNQHRPATHLIQRESNAILQKPISHNTFDIKSKSSLEKQQFPCKSDIVQEKEKIELNNFDQRPEQIHNQQKSQENQQISVIVDPIIEPPPEASEHQQQEIAQTQSLPELQVIRLEVHVDLEQENETFDLPFPFNQILTFTQLFSRENLFLRLDNLIENFLRNFTEAQEEEQQGMTDEQIDQIQKKIFNGNQETMCPICQCNLIAGEDLLILGCRHLFHYHCLKPWLKLKPRCPTCRFGLVPSEID